MPHVSLNSLRLTVLVAAGAATLAALAPATAAAGGRVTPGSRYLALGDSVTLGYQEPSLVPPPNYGRPASLRGCPEQLGSLLRLQVANASCPGETSASLINAA